jgi:hypothetical protein
MSAAVGQAMEDGLYTHPAIMFVVATGNQADALNQVLPPGCYATAPGRGNYGRRFERLVVMIPLPTGEGQLQDWFETAVLTRLTPAARIDYLPSAASTCELHSGVYDLNGDGAV